jgi:hypothetical protein
MLRDKNEIARISSFHSVQLKNPVVGVCVDTCFLARRFYFSPNPLKLADQGKKKLLQEYYRQFFPDLLPHQLGTHMRSNAVYLISED